jgi:hypothetical protein
MLPATQETTIYTHTKQLAELLASESWVAKRTLSVVELNIKEFSEFILTSFLMKHIFTRMCWCSSHTLKHSKLFRVTEYWTYPVSGILINAMFLKLDLLPCSGERVGGTYFLGLLERRVSSSGI